MFARFCVSRMGFVTISHLNVKHFEVAHITHRLHIFRRANRFIIF